MSAIPPNTSLDGFVKSMREGVEGAFKKGVKHGRYLEQQERIADRVPRDEHDALLRRFRHLLESDFIHSFDEYDSQTQTYKRDIAEADEIARVIHCRDCEHWRPSPFRDPVLGWCIIAGHHRRPDYYCADADPKEVRHE